MTNINRLLLLVVLIGTSNFSLSQDSLETDLSPNLTFEMLLDSTQMIFMTPDGFKEVEPVQNKHMNYEKAFQHPSKKFEVRYAIRRHNFGWYRQMFEMTALNISDGELPDYTNFGTEAVKNEFNADAGCVINLKVKKEFGIDYKYCLFVYIFKKGIGDAFMFYMADDYEIIPELMQPIFHALKFDEEN